MPTWDSADAGAESPKPRAAPLRICLVCLGNICRSPMAAAVLRSRLAEAGLADQVTIDSAGIGAWHIGGPADPRALSALQARGFAADDHRARQFGVAAVDQYDLILAMDRENLADLRRLAPDAARRDAIQLLRAYDPVALATDELDVADPYQGDDAGFVRALAEIEAAVDGLVATLERELRGLPE